MKACYVMVNINDCRWLFSKQNVCGVMLYAWRKLRLNVRLTNKSKSAHFINEG